MLPHAHLAVGLLLGSISYRLGLIGFWDIFFVAALSVLIDIDHIIHFAFENHSWNPWKFWNQCVEYLMKDKTHHRTVIHHIVGMIIIFPAIILTMFVSFIPGFILLLAYGSHMILDHIYLLGIKAKRYLVVDFLGFKFPLNVQQEIIVMTIGLIGLIII